MKCKEARFMLRKQEEDSRNKMTSRRLLAKEQEDERASSSTATAVETASSTTAATTIHISAPSASSSQVAPKTHPNVVCVKSSTAAPPTNMPKKLPSSANVVPSILRCGPQFLVPKPMFGPVSNNTTILQAPPLVRKRETVKELLMRNSMSKGGSGGVVERKDGPNIVLALDAQKHSAPGPVSVCAPGSSNPRQYLIVGNPIGASRQPSPLQNPAQPDSSKM